IQHLQKADENTTTVVSAVKGLHKEYSAHLQRIEEALQSSNMDHQKQITKVISDSIKKMGDATNSFSESQGLFDKTIKTLVDKYKLLAAETNKLVEKIDKVDFPVRLDKLDATVSSINQGLQNTQQRIGDVERNLKDDLQAKSKDMVGKIEGSEKEVKQLLGTIQKENQLLKILMFVTLALSVGTIVILLVKL
ncbi:MAG TPA: hypothetical protein PLS08_08710, partial [Chryseolinea sp.]|nr:hypothetical protein [Chryseolinea sp.]